MAKVSLEFTGEDKDLTATLQRMQREMVKLQEANAKLVQESKKAAKEAKDSQGIVNSLTSNWVAGLAGVIASYTGVGAAIRGVNAELERQKQLQNDVASRQLGLVASERGYLSNLGGTAADRQASIQELQRIAQQRGIPLDQAYRSAGAALGFTQGGVGSQANRALDVAARFNPYDTEQLTYGLLAAQKLTGSNDPLANLGFIKSVQDFSPIANTGLLAQNLIPGALGVKTIGGGTDIEAASLVNAISDVRVDVTGQESAGTAQRLARAAKAVYPHLTTDQAIAEAQRDPRAAKRIADKIENSVTKAAAEQLLFNPNSDAAKAYRASKAGIAGGDSRVNRAEAAIAANEATSIQALGSLDRSLAAGSESLAVGNTTAGVAGTLRNRLEELRLQADTGVGDNFLASQIYERGLNLGASPGTAAGLSAAYTRQTAVRGGASNETINKLDAMIRLLDQIASGQLDKPTASRALRQNAVNDLDRHTEGR